jgi:hypothetical protein
MESYGLHWNDDTASYLEDYYDKECSDCLYQLIGYLDISDEKRLQAKVIYEDNITYGEKFYKLKSEIFNPLSNLSSSQEPFWTVYKTNHSQALAVLYYLDVNIHQSGMIPESIMDLLDKENVYTTLDNLCNYNENIVVKKYIDLMISKMYNEIDDFFKRFAAEILEFHYNAQVRYGGVNIDDPSTWGKEFQMLYLLRRFKKVIKSKSVYINGKTGRNTVWLSRITDPTQPPIRIEPYWEWAKHRSQLKSDEVFILNTDFADNMAETRRWRAGQ